MQSIGLFKYSPIESRRFDLRVYRGVLNDIDWHNILSTILKENIDVGIIRVPTERQDSLACLERMGIPYIVADTLVFYDVDLKKYEPKEIGNKELEFIECYPEHLEIMNALVSEIFHAYKNHYASNPILALDITEAYKEWASNYATNIAHGKCAWLVKLRDNFVGFGAFAFGDKESEGVLLGVIPSARGMGIYGDLLRFIQRFSKDNGCSIMKISTQVQNYVVQKVWIREGFLMKQAYLTIHINSLMNASRVGEKVFYLTVSLDDIIHSRFVDGNVSLRRVDDEYAHRLGFEGGIVHELLAHHTILNYYGTEFPGDGTVLAGCSCKSLRPIHVDKLYRIEISFPLVNHHEGTYKSLVKIFDSSGELCLFSYYDLVNKRKC